MDDLVELVLGEHARLNRLFEELEGADNPVRLAAVWMELSAALRAHMGAFEEVLLLPLLGTTQSRVPVMRSLNADKDDIRDALAGSSLLPTGSFQWWLAVRAVQAAVGRHISSVEGGPLPKFGQQAPEWSRQELGHQWKVFISAFSRDGHPAVLPDRGRR